MVRFFAGHSIAPAASHPCTWSVRGAANNGWCWAQIATDAKSNEITAVPPLLKMLSLKGAIVTTDALNCQLVIAQQIVEQGGDYALALKGSKSTLHDDVSTYLAKRWRQGVSTRQDQKSKVG
jgi:predicted transposase YbfD/YdcC